MFPVLAAIAALGPPDGPNAKVVQATLCNFTWNGTCLGGMSMIAQSDKLGFPVDLQFKPILFVCWGNICRSPAAASILKREMKRIGGAGLHVESAGVCPEDQPQNPSLRMRWVSFRRGVWLKSKQRLLTRKDLACFDLIIAEGKGGTGPVREGKEGGGEKGDWSS